MSIRPRSPLWMDDDNQNLGNSPGDDGRGRLHSKISNTAAEAVPVFVTNASPITKADVNQFQDITAVTSGSETLITSYTVPVAKTLYLARVESSGTNIATFNLYINGSLSARRRTYFGSSLNETFEFFTKDGSGLILNAGDVLSIKVIHFRPSTGDFEARIQGVLEG